MTYRDYDPDKDSLAVRRIWKEVGWLREEETDGIYLDGVLRDADNVLIATLDGEAECAAIGVSGNILYLDTPIPLGVIAGVTTSRVARKLGFARDLTVKLLARQASAGLAVSALGMFEQGYYDKLGFGTGPYEQWIRFDPASLTVTNSFRPPKRLHVRDYEAVHAALCSRRRGHGGVVLGCVQITRADLGMTQDAFGLGYYDGDNRSLSHFICGSAAGQHGPYVIKYIAWQTPEQLLELLALIKSLGDQVSQVAMLEIGAIQLQDLLKQPIRTRRATRDGQFVNDSHSLAFWQFRILDLAACLEATHLNTARLRFNLALDDPVAPYLDESDWRGISGEYVVELGELSCAEPGRDSNLPTLKASVNAFSRMWLGIRPASSLALTDTLSADPELLSRLDATLRLPRPHAGIEF